MANITKIIKDLNTKNKQENYPAPIWLLNDQLTKLEIESQINQMSEQGISKFIVKPENGIIPEHTSFDFKEYFLHILECAKKNQMNVLLSEDIQYSDPGICSSITSKDPDTRMSYLCLSDILKLKGPRKVTVEDLKDNEEESIQYLFAIRIKDRMLEFQSAKNITQFYKNGTLKWKIPSGDWRIFVFNTKYNKKPVGGYIYNCLSEKATNQFLKEAFSELINMVPKDLKTTFSGFFLEVPSVAPDNSIRGLPWSDDISKKVRTKCSTDVMSTILALYIENYSKKNLQIRYTYYNLLLELLGSNFIRPILKFGNDTKYDTNLLLNSGDLYSSENILRFDYSELIKKYDISGISNNTVCNQEEIIHKRFFSQLMSYYSSKRASTIIGRNRNGIGYNLKDLKFESDCISHAGLHEQYIDGNYYKLKYQSGLRAPTNTFIYSKFFKKYNLLLDYIYKKNELFKKLAHDEEIGIFYPSNSIYASYNPSNLSAYKLKTKNFYSLVNYMLDNSLGFNFFNEENADQLTLNNTGDAVLKIKNKIKCSFKIIVIPEASVISEKFLSFLEKFVKKGGKIIFFGILPNATYERGKQSDIIKTIDTLQFQIPNSIYKFTKEEELDFIKSICLKAIEKPTEIKTETEKINQNHIISRAFTDGIYNYYIFINTLKNRSYKSEVKITDPGYLYYLDLNNSSIYSLPSSDQKNTINPFVYNFGPGETAVFILSDNKLNAPVNPKLPIEETNRLFRIILKDEWEYKRLDPNVIPITNWFKRINSNKEVNSGYNLAYESYIDVESIPEKCGILIKDLINIPTNGLHSGNFPVEISFNGVKLKEMQFFGRGETRFNENEYFHKSDYGNIKGYFADITQYVKKGINRITVKSFSTNFYPLMIKYPPLFVGNFTLKRGNRGWIISNKNPFLNYGSMNDQGYAFYYGTMVYSQTFENPGKFGKVFIRFTNFESEINIRINDNYLEMPPWQPCVKEITKFVNSGKNHIDIEVTNMHNNLINMAGLSSGLTGQVFVDVHN